MPDNDSDKDKNQTSGDLNLPPKAATDWGANLREWTTTVIGLGVSLVSLYMLWLTFKAAGDSSTFAQKSQVMQYGLSLVGVVLGYYFGRVPLERRVEAAETSAKDSNKAKDVSDKKLQEVKVTLAETLGMMAPAGEESTRVMSKEGGAHWAAYSKLDALQGRL